MSFPHGECECGHLNCPCSAKPGPAAFEVTRGGRRVKLCTRCDLTNDRGKILLVLESDRSAPYREHDELGMICLAVKLAEARQLNKSLQED